MSTYYLLPIGGSGARVMRAFLYLCLAGCFKKTDCFKVKIIDSDEGNGDLADLISVWDLYDKVQESCKELELPKVITVTASSVSGKRWSPVDNTNDTLEKMLDYSGMREARELVDFTFSNDEKTNVYKGGFYGHTSVGSYFMKDHIVKEDGSFTDEWSKFFDGHKAGDKVFVFGSFFGGTGASGIPTISRIIAENRKDNTNDMIIGAEFIMPYFAPAEVDASGENKLKIDWTTFSVKTKTALNFYVNQHYDDIFKSFYCIGEDPDDFMRVPNKVQGKEQKNKPNHIEMLAATAILDFINSDNPEFNLKLLGAEKKITADYIDGLFSDVKIATQIEKFFAAAVIYTKYIYYCIEDGKSPDWKVDKKAFDSDTNKDIYDMCLKFIEWVRQISVGTDEKGLLSYRTKANRFEIINTDKKYDFLYDGQPVDHQKDGGFWGQHKKYELDQFKLLSEIFTGRTLKDVGIIIKDDFGRKKCKSWSDLIRNLLEAIKYE